MLVAGATQVGDLVEGIVQSVEARKAHLELAGGINAHLSKGRVSRDNLTDGDFQKMFNTGDRVKVRGSGLFPPKPLVPVACAAAQ